MLDPEGQAYDKIADVVSIQDFYHPENKRIFEAVQNLTEAGKLTDLLTVSDWLDNSGNFDVKPAIQYISELVENTAGTVNIREYGEIVREKALLRELITISNNIAQSAYKPEGKLPSQLVDEAEQKIFEIAGAGLIRVAPMEEIIRISDLKIGRASCRERV